jgi:uncharacterized RDD family membrane protein YckC
LSSQLPLSSSDDQLTVHSVTGVDLTLTVAGPGTRSYAFVIDWHIRFLVAAAWMLVAFYVLNFTLSPRSHDALFSLLPALLIYFLYHPILEVAMRGRTPGKRMAGVRILNRAGGSPSVAALLIRNIFRIIDSLPLLYVVGLATCFLTANRVRIGDLAAGTLLAVEDTAAEKALARVETLAAGSRLPLDTLELVDQILERWPSLEISSRAEIARSLLARLIPADGSSELAGMGDTELHARLQALLTGGGGAGHD